MEMWAGWIVAGVVTTLLVFREVRARRESGRGRQSVDAVVAQLKQAVTRATELTLDHDAMRESVERERKRADEYFSLIEGVTAERDDRMKLYYEQATEHGAAQAMLLRQIESLVKQFQRVSKGQMPQLNPAVELVTQEFQMRHVARAQAETAAAPQSKTGLCGG